MKKKIEDKSTIKDIENKIRISLDTFNDFQKNFGSIIPQSLVDGSYLKNSSSLLKEFSEQMEKNQLMISKNFSSIIEKYSESARIIKESLEPQILLWQTWVKQNASIYENINKQWSDSPTNYRIAEIEAVEILQKYNWFISINMPISFVYYIIKIGRRKGRQDKALNKLFYNFFSKNNWEFLEFMISNWKSHTLFRKRYKIAKDCIDFLKSSSKVINHANVLLPTLIVLIDGFLSDYLDSKEISYSCHYKDMQRNGRIIKVGRMSQFEKNICGNLTSEIDIIAKDIFLNILFQSSKKGKPLSIPLNFNRHKILHGENIYYGRKDYLIRAFLIIDFLLSLK